MTGTNYSTSSITVLDTELTKRYGSYVSAAIMEQYRGSNFHLWLNQAFEWDTAKPVRAPHYKTCDADHMTQEEFNGIIRPYLEEYEEQIITLADFVPDCLKPVRHEVTNTTVLTPFLSTVFNNCDEETFLECLDATETLMWFYHHFSPTFKSKFIKFLNSAAPHLEAGYIHSLIYEFVKIDSTNAKIFKNKMKLNEKTLNRLQKDLDQFLADSPLEEYECQMFEWITSLGKTTDNISKVAENLASATNGLDGKLGNMESSVSGVTDKIVNLIDSLTPAAANAGHVQGFVDKLIQNAKDHSLAIALCFHELITEKNYKKWFTSLLSITSMLGFNKTMIDALMSSISSSSQQQSGTLKLLALASTMLGKYNPVNMLGMGTAFTAVREMKALEELANLVEEVAEEWGLKTSPATELANQIKTEVAELLEELIDLETLEATCPSKFLLTKNAERVSQGYAKITDLEKRFIRSSAGLTNSTVVAEVQKLTSQYKSLQMRVNNIRRGEARRQEPVALVFVGAPGIGKSKFATDLISGNSLLKKAFLAKGLKDKSQWLDMPIDEWHVWNENVSESMDYADGYCGQEIHATDDLFQSANDNDHQRYINYISPQRYLTNQASLEAKGTPYTSKLFVGSCNVFPTSSKTIKEVSALQRRFVVIDCKLTGTLPTSYDKDFKHLSFDVYKTGVDYVNFRKDKTVTKDQLVDMVLNLLQAKYKMYCQEMEFTYEEQAAFSNLKRQTAQQMYARCRNSTRYDAQDWHYNNSDPHKAFIRIKYKLTADNLHALLERARQDPSYYDPEKVMKQYKEWIYTSSDAVKKFAIWDVFFSYVEGEREIVLKFEMEKGEAVCYYYDTVDKTMWDDFYDLFCAPSLFTNYAYTTIRENLWNAYSNMGSIFKTICDQFKKGYEHFKKWCSSPLDSVQCLLTNIALSLGQFTCVQVLEYFLNTTLNVVVSVAIGYMVALIYKKITSYAIGNTTCLECETQNQKITIGLTKIREQVCKKYCKLGHVYSSHTDNCSQMAEVIKDLQGMFCSCQGDCENSCSHHVEDKERKYAVFREVCIQVYGTAPSVLDSYFSGQLDIEIDDEVEVTCLSCTSGRFCKRHAEYEKFQSIILDELMLESGSSLTTKSKKKMDLESGSSLTTKNKKKMDVESGSSLTTKQKKKVDLELADRKRIKSSRSPLGCEEMYVTHEMQTDPNAFAIVDSIAQVIVRCFRTQNGVKGELNGLAYKNFIITPAHLYSDYTTDYYIFKMVNGEETKIPLKLIHADRDRDVALWHFTGEPFPARLADHLCPKEDLINYLPSTKTCVMLIPAKSEKNKYLHILNCSGTYFQSKRVHFLSGDSREYKEVLKVVGLNHPAIQTEKGDCGSPIFMCNPKAQKKIIGFHILGGSAGAYSTVLTKEIFEDLLSHSDKNKFEIDDEEDMFFEALDQPFIPDNSEIECGASLPVYDIMSLCNEVSSNPLYQPGGDIEYIGQYEFNSVAAKDTSIEKHLLYGTFPVTQVPAALSLSEVKDTSKLSVNCRGNPDILLTQFEKYNKVFTPIENVDDDLDDMVDQLTGYFQGVLRNEDLSVMTEEETLSGIVENSNSNPLDVRTTAGEPFARLGKTQGKKKNAFLSIKLHSSGKKIYSIDRSTTHGQYLADEIDHKDKLAQQGIRTLSIWKNCLKDETRPVEKVEVGKTRLFTAAPFDTVFLGRKYFGKFKEAWQNNRTKLFHSVGINAMSPEWSELAMTLISKGENFSDADFGSYDGNLRPEFMRAAGRIVIKTITSSTRNDPTPYYTIWEEFVETFHVSGRNVHLVKHGNPSGNPMTTVVNCIVNLLYHWWCFRKITGFTSLSKFSDQVGFTCFGDDVLYSTNEEITGYTFNEVAKWMKVLEQDYTTAEKKTGDVLRKDISEIQFLKRKFFRITDRTYLAPIDTDSIEQQFNYTMIGQNDYATVAQQIQEASVEAALHGKEYYTHFKKSLDGAIWNNDLLRQHVSCVETYHDVRAVAEKRSLEQIS